MNYIATYTLGQPVIVKRTSGDFEVWKVEAVVEDHDGETRFMVTKPHERITNAMYYKHPTAEDLMKWEEELRGDMRENKFIALMEDGETQDNAHDAADDYADNAIAEMLA